MKPPELIKLLQAVDQTKDVYICTRSYYDYMKVRSVKEKEIYFAVPPEEKPSWSVIILDFEE